MEVPGSLRGSLGALGVSQEASGGKCPQFLQIVLKNNQKLMLKAQSKCPQSTPKVFIEFSQIDPRVSLTDKNS